LFSLLDKAAKTTLAFLFVKHYSVFKERAASRFTLASQAFLVTGKE